MGTRISDISGAFRGPENVTAAIMIQGEQSRYRIKFEREGAAVDTSTWTITARAEYYTAVVGESGSGADVVLSIANLKPAEIDPRELPVGIAPGSVDDAEADGGKRPITAADGLWDLEIPGDLYEEDIPINAETNVPVVAICITINNGNAEAIIRRFRHVLIIRRGW